MWSVPVFFFLLLLFLIPSSTATTKMVVVVGVVDVTATYNFYSKLDVEEWQDCVDECFLNEKCMVASNIGSCVLFFQGDVFQIKKTDNFFGTDTTAIKVSSDSLPNTCPGLVETLGIFTKMGDESIYGSMGYTVAISAGYYTVKYSFSLISDTCKDWLERVPQCEAPCSKMMMPFYGEYESGTKTAHPDATTLRECMMKCFMADSCVTVGFIENACYEYEQGTATSTQYTFSYVAVKMIFDETNCPTSAQDALSGRTYPIESSDSFSSYTISKGAVSALQLVQWNPKQQPQVDPVNTF